MNPSSTPTPEEQKNLADLLRRRLEIIGDNAWRDADPAAHLDGLKSVSEQIMAVHDAMRGRIHPRLEHFLAGCSYEKALAFLENELMS